MDRPADDSRSAEERAFDALLAASERGETLPTTGSAPLAADLRRGFEALPKPRETPRSVGEFVLQEQIATGGMGVVWSALQTSLKRTVVVKLLRADRASDESADAVFRREAELLAHLEHPNIVRIHAYGIDDGVAWIAMEKLEGRTLAAEIEQRGGSPLPIATALPIAIQVASALAAAHAAGIVHRDVKPSNIFLCTDGRAVLLDFGIARNVEGQHLTMTGTFKGTPAYAAPEQIAASFGEVGPYTDVFALGVTLYEMLVGRKAFPGTSTDRVFLEILTTEPLAPRRANPSLSRDVETVIVKAIEKESARRYADARAFGDDLKALLEYRAIRARPADAMTRILRWRRRNPASAVVIAAVLILVAALPAWNWFGQRAAAHAKLGEARSGLAMLVHWRERLAVVDSELAPIERDLNLRHLERDVVMRLFELRAERDDLRRNLDVAYMGALSAAGDARQHLAAAETDRLAAELHLERWRRAVDERDRAGMAAFAQLVRNADSAGLLTAHLEPRQRVVITSDPEGADVHLYEYVEQRSLVPAGEPRLVPVPIDHTGKRIDPPLPPGTIVLRVVQSVGEILIGDLVLRHAGRPIADTIVVPYDSPDKSVLAGDRLVSVDGSLIREAQDVTVLYDLEDADPTVTRRFEFERAGSRFILEAAGLDALGIRAWEPDNVLAEVGGSVTMWRAGAIVECEVPPLITRTTATPCFASPGNRVGVTPVELELRVGSYLAVISREGSESARRPFVVERDVEPRIGCRLNPAGTTPPGFVFIPGGTFAAGGDPQSFAGFEARDAMVGDFWIQERELVFGDWLPFVNDPGVRAEIGRSPVPIRFPRDPATGEMHPKWTRAADGGFAIPPGRAMFPLSQVSVEDVEAYVAWRNRRAEEDGLQFEFGMPTELEWEKAARGADRRAFVFGDVFAPSWVKGRFGHPRLGPELVLRFPRDESPYGVFDLAGSMWEACSEPWSAESAAYGRAVRGADWNSIYEANFRAASRAEVDRASAQVNLGFRLVLRPRPR